MVKPTANNPTGPLTLNVKLPDSRLPSNMIRSMILCAGVDGDMGVALQRYVSSTNGGLATECRFDVYQVMSDQ